MAKSIMFQGTGSGVGKSLLTAGFCRLLNNMGVSVAPFKSQNMALNAGVTTDGLEMGRAQILQAEAAGITPDVRMNPILLKPQGEAKSQLVRMGMVAGVYSAREYYTLSSENFDTACKAYDSLASQYEVIVMEGAGSPAEINLHKTDIVNMRMAEYANADVQIIGDIDRGGVFAWMKGTYDLLPADTARLVKGFIINKFRGDKTLLEPGIRMFGELIPVPVTGIMPHMRLSLEEEDSQDIQSDTEKAEMKVGVVRLPYISNFSDFAPLKAMKCVQLVYASKPHELYDCDIVIIPGSKHTIYDMKFLRESGFAEAVKKAVGRIPVIGICGGFQMLGEKITDPLGIEGEKGGINGLGLLPVSTVITQQKELIHKEYAGRNAWSGLTLTGYEMHMGRTETGDLVSLAENGVCTAKGKVFGTYLHGFFEHSENIKALNSLLGTAFEETDYVNEKERQLDLLAETIKHNCDIDLILKGVL
ncbi:cobyric acid synthase [Geovibrio thiophilus]|uniref:Cobyric acid synthase n=1 Tax=Geovibrio thiophilus TaxID=139438 RepID=A0A3R5X364_9BACT|nr:cobyric acid synthase [Geovibrio thiophilus]QAR33447.1 cobyric acid synthase [Geovibrio thiophilus]